MAKKLFKWADRQMAIILTTVPLGKPYFSKGITKYGNRNSSLNVMGKHSIIIYIYRSLNCIEVV